MNGVTSAGEAWEPVAARARIDRALSIVRALPASELFAALWPSAILVLLSAALYFVERVEGIRSLRPVFGAMFASAFVLRSVKLSRWAGRRAESLLAVHGLSAQHTQTQVIARAALWVGMELWCWLWLVVLMIRLEPWLVVPVLPCFCLRAAWFPHLLASADGSTQATGLALLTTALHEGEGQRVTAVTCELLLLGGALGLAFNLGAVVVTGVGLGQDLLGLDLAFVRAFLSHRNYLALLLVAGCSLVAMEPVRAALSALLYADARLSRDGLALRSLITRCVSETGRARRVALALAACLSLSNVVQAQDSSIDLTVKNCDQVCERAQAGDDAINRRVTRILAGDAFVEFPEERFPGQPVDMSTWLDVMARWLASLSREEQVASGRPATSALPGAPFFIALAILFALLSWWLMARRPPRVLPEPSATDARDDPWAVSPDAYLTLARKARSSDLSVALRSLYMATLVGLSRRGRITLAPECTNGQYLRQLGRSPDRELFAQLTGVFDLVRYGKQPPSQADFDRCLALAETLVAPGPTT